MFQDIVAGKHNAGKKNQYGKSFILKNITAENVFTIY